MLPPHHLAARDLHLPPPGDRALPQPSPPPNPALDRPPLDNPGGVDGTRPPRGLRAQRSEGPTMR
jgi:hypothetical protein